MAGVRVVALSRVAGGFWAVVVGLTLAACDDGRTRVVVRTELPEDAREQVEAAFEEAHSDIDLRFSVRADDVTAPELRDDEDVSYDVWWGAPSSDLEELTRAGRLAGWMPWASSPFVVVFDRDSVGLVNAPEEWIDVLHHGWFEEVLLPDPTRARTGTAFVLGAVAESTRTEGESYIGFEWLERIDDQVVRYVADAQEAVRGVRTGSASLAVVPLATFEANRGDDETLHHRRPRSRAADFPAGVGLVRQEGPTAEAAARFAAFVTADQSRELTLPAGWEEPSAWQRDDVVMVVDSASVWVTRWRETVRGRGK
jgi:ABC-type Fe3+ transport system substrate-binding protein